ncbi:MAG: RNA polymerase sigma factor [Clostridia bacterium]
MERKQLDSLIQQMQDGDETAFALLYAETKKGVFSYLYTFTTQRELAEDLMQETYIKVRQNVQSYKLGTNPIAWLLQIAKNLALNEFKRGNKQVLTDFNEFDVPDSVSVEEQADSHVFDTINKNLSKEEARIVLLHLVNGLKHREIAELISKPLGTVLWSYKNSLEKLKKILKKEEE